SGGRIAFGELRHATLALAGWLGQDCDIGPGARVALCLPKSLEAIQAIFGILAEGAAYVPLQFDGPPARLAAILESVKPHLLITTPETAARLAAYMEARRLPATRHIEIGRGLAALLADATPAKTIPEIESGDLAVILFTSGSTGEPKGVMIAHGAIVNRVSPPFEWDEVVESDRLILNAGLPYVGAPDLFLPVPTG